MEGHTHFHRTFGQIKTMCNFVYIQVNMENSLWRTVISVMLVWGVQIPFDV